MHEVVGYAPNKMQVIPNGFELEKLVPVNTSGAAVRDELGISKSCKVVIGMPG